MTGRLPAAALLAAAAALPAHAQGLLYAQPSYAHPGYVSGDWYPGAPSGAAGGAGAAVTAADTVYCIPAAMQRPFTVKALGLRITAAGTSASVKLALYGDDTSTYRPGALLASTGAISIAGTGDSSAGVAANYSGPPGAYWLCSLWTWSVAPSASQISSSALDYAALVGGDSVQHAVFSVLHNGVSYTTAGLYASGFPASLSGLTGDVAASAVTLPIMAWQQN